MFDYWVLEFIWCLEFGLWLFIIFAYHFPNILAKKLFFIPMAA